MRPDMDKVIIERPRRGSRTRGDGERYASLNDRIPIEDWPKHERIGLRGGRTKSQTDRLGPLRRYLQSQVGRNWNKVYSEICANFHAGSAVQSHVRDHVLRYVTIHVIEIDGVKCFGAGMWRGQPLTNYHGALFYVCPKSGMLRENKPKPRRYRKPVVEQVRVDSTREYRLMDGIWYEVQLKPITAEAVGQRDIVLGTTVDMVEVWRANRAYGDAVYAASRRQLNHREIRRLGLNKRQRAR